MLLSPVSGELVPGIEIVVDLDAELMSPEGVWIFSGTSAAGNRATGPAIDGGVQAVNRNAAYRGHYAWSVECIRSGHVGEQLLHETTGIDARAEGIAGIQRIAEHAEALHWPRRSGDAGPIQWVAKPVDDRSD